MSSMGRWTPRRLRNPSETAFRNHRHGLARPILSFSGEAMKAFYACNSAEHTFSRRQFLAGTAAGGLGLLGFNGMVTPAAAQQLQRAQKRVLVIWLSGGVSQLETWDPKPGTNTGGPFLAIP